MQGSLTIHSSRHRFAARLNSGARPHDESAKCFGRNGNGRMVDRGGGATLKFSGCNFADYSPYASAVPVTDLVGLVVSSVAVSPDQ